MFNWSPFDKKDKVVKDSVKAMDAVKNKMTEEQKKKAYSQMCTGLGPDGVSQLCDRKASKNFQ